MDHSLGSVCEHLRGIGRIVGFTGAGISTESGIPDYRGEGGIWTKYRVVTLQAFLASHEGRVEYWQRKAATWPSVRDAAPTKGHQAFQDLCQQGRLAGLITQNIDGLHQAAGLPEEMVIELHGNTRTTSCLDCGAMISTEEAMQRIAEGDLAPACDDCGGWLKPATISFGQAMPEEKMRLAAELAQECEAFVAVGSSLAVQPAASLPVLARQAGAVLIIVNRNETTVRSERCCRNSSGRQADPVEMYRLWPPCASCLMSPRLRRVAAGHFLDVFLPGTGSSALAVEQKTSLEEFAKPCGCQGSQGQAVLRRLPTGH